MSKEGKPIHLKESTQVPMSHAEYDNLIAKGQKKNVDSNAKLIVKGKLILNGVVQKFDEKDIVEMKLRDKKNGGRILDLHDIQ